MSGPKHPNWKGGKQTNNAYISVYNPNHPSNSKGYVLEHRLVLEKELGRYLTAKERVHHINHIKNDNHKENLILFKNGIAHYYFHKNGRYVPEEVVFDGRYKAI